MWMIELAMNTITAETRIGSQSAAMEVMGVLLCVSSWWPLRPPRTSASWPSELSIMTRAMSAERRTRATAPSWRNFELRTCCSLFSMSSALQPRVCAMNGNCGNWQPSSAKKVRTWPTTACTLSWPPVTTSETTLFRSRWRFASVSWFWMQFMRSIIL